MRAISQARCSISRRSGPQRDRPNVVLVHYDDLSRDLGSEMRRLAGILGITVPEDRWPELVDAATFERMRAAADHIAPDISHAIWQDNRRFFHRGTSGQMARPARRRRPPSLRSHRVAQLGEADLVAWVHHAFASA